MLNDFISLDLLKIGESAEVIKINSNDNIKRRLLDIGILEKSNIECVLNSPFNDPHAYLIKGALIAIRNEDAKSIIVRRLTDE